MSGREHVRPFAIFGVLLTMLTATACSTGASENATRAHATTRSPQSPSTTAASDQNGQTTSSSAAEGENHPQAVFSETTYNAGTVQAGTEITHTFRVVNTGKADLVIERVKPG